jgi:hypothetical protein
MFLINIKILIFLEEKDICNLELLNSKTKNNIENSYLELIKAKWKTKDEEINEYYQEYTSFKKLYIKKTILQRNLEKGRVFSQNSSNKQKLFENHASTPLSMEYFMFKTKLNTKNILVSGDKDGMICLWDCRIEEVNNLF